MTLAGTTQDPEIRRGQDLAVLERDELDPPGREVEDRDLDHRLEGDLGQLGGRLERRGRDVGPDRKGATHGWPGPGDRRERRDEGEGPGRHGPRAPLVVLALALMLVTPAHAREPAGGPVYPSTNPIVRAAREMGLEVELLLAVAKVESSFRPYALNVGGRPHFPTSLGEATRILDRSGDGVDIGLFQVHFAIWGDRLGLTKRDLLDPYQNSLAGAKILKGSIEAWGLEEGVGRYHSSRPERWRPYSKRVLKTFDHYRRNRHRIVLAP